MMAMMLLQTPHHGTCVTQQHTLLFSSPFFFLPCRSHQNFPSFGRSVLRLKARNLESGTSISSTASLTLQRKHRVIVSSSGDETEAIAALPFPVNTSLIIDSWGDIYTGPNGISKYWNSTKTHPYPVGFVSVKVYKGHKFKQTIKEGPEHGPVFVIEDENGRVFVSDSPQKVWNEVTAEDGVQVHGGRHFGFQSQEVVRTLQRMAHNSQVPALGLGSSVFRMNLDKVKNQEQSLQNGTSSNAMNQIISAAEQEKSQFHNTNLLGDYRDHNDGEEYDVTIALECVTGNESQDTYQDDHKDDIDTALADSDCEDDVDDDFVSGIVMSDDEIDGHDDDSDIMNLVEEEEENEENDSKDVINFNSEEDGGPQDNQEDLDFSPFEIYSGSSSDTTLNKTSSLLPNTHKRSFKAGTRKFTFKITPSTPYNELEKDDPRFHTHNYTERNVTNNPSMITLKPKLTSGVEKQVWRKGEGLTNRGAGNAKKHGTETFLGDQRNSNEGRNSNVSNNFNGNKVWEASVSRRKEEYSKSSHMLLDLLQKWNTINKWTQESGSRSTGLVQKDSFHASDDVNKEHKRSSFSKFSYQDPSIESSSLSKSSLHEQVAINGSSEHGDSLLSELKNSSNIDESTNFAISKLFETVGKKDDAQKSPQNLGKPVMQDSNLSSLECNNPEKIVQEQSTGTHALKPHTEVIDAFHDLQNLVQDERRTSNFQQKREISKATERKADPKPARFPGRIVDEEKHEIQERGVDEIKKLTELRNLVTKKRFLDALQALRSMKSSGISIDEDMYEVMMGFKLDPWQKQVFKQVQKGNSVLISAPAGAGKSAVVDCCIYRNVIEQQRLLFVTPSESLADQKLQKYGNLFGRNNVGGIWTKMRVQKGPQLVVITLETLAKILQELNGPGGSEFRFFFEGINTVVFDKFHTFSEVNCGCLWEEVLMLLDSRIKIIAISLPVANEDQIASWIDMNHGPCKLVSCSSEGIPKRYFFAHSSKLLPLFDPKGVELNSSLSDPSGNFGHPLVGKNLESFLLCGYDRSSLCHILTAADVNGMLPAIVVFFNVEGCSNALHDAIAAVGKGLLSQAEIHKMEMFLAELHQSHSDIGNHLDAVDLEGLHKGIATYHEGQLPVWQEFILKLEREDLLKVIIVTERCLLHTEMFAHSIIIPTINRVIKNEVSSIPCGRFMELVGRAGRRSYDTEGNVVFLKNLYSGPHEIADLVLNNNFRIDSQFKPSYSLVVNLMAKHNISEVKRILRHTFADFQFYTKHLRARKLEDLDKKILDCLEAKAAAEAKLHQGLTEVNRKKLLDAVMFTRLDIRMTIHSSSENGNSLPGILLAVVPGQSETFYMVFGADNNFRLLPAGAFDHVYAKEDPPLDSVYKQSTGESLQPPLIPSKEKWIVEENGSYGYVASGTSQTKEFVRLLTEYPVQPMLAKEGLELRKEILGSEAQISDLIERRKKLQLENYDIVKKLDLLDLTEPDGDDSNSWKEALRILKLLEKVDAFSIIETQAAYIKLKPLGMLISRLHNAENELWLAAVVTSNYVRQLSPAEFIGILAMMVSLEPGVESLFSDQREFLYRVPKPLKDAFVNLRALRKQIAALQGSCNPPLQFDTALAGMVYAWARGKPGTNGFSLVRTNVDGAVAWKLRVIARFANQIYEACTQVSVDISEPSDFNNLSSLARRAEDLLSRHLIDVD